MRRVSLPAERSAQSRYITDAAAHVVTGFEALLNTDEDAEITRQFVKHWRQPADELGVERHEQPVLELDLREAVRSRPRSRSRLVAPAGWYETDAEPPADVKKIAKAQDVLRAAVRRAIESEELRAEAPWVS
jgi:hypothetical protein